MVAAYAVMGCPPVSSVKIATIVPVFSGTLLEFHGAFAPTTPKFYSLAFDYEKKNFFVIKLYFLVMF